MRSRGHLNEHVTMVHHTDSRERAHVSACGRHFKWRKSCKVHMARCMLCRSQPGGACNQDNDDGSSTVQGTVQEGSDVQGCLSREGAVLQDHNVTQEEAISSECELGPEKIKQENDI